MRGFLFLFLIWFIVVGCHEDNASNNAQSTPQSSFDDTSSQKIETSSLVESTQSEDLPDAFDSLPVNTLPKN